MSWGGIPASMILDLARQNGAMYQQDLDLDCPPWVFVDPRYLTTEANGYSVVLSNGYNSGVLGTEDHPRFRDTRDWLARNEYIHKETGWSNGDRVTKPFYFNNVYMAVGDQFACAGAMKYTYGKPELYNNGKILPGVPNYKPGEELVEIDNLKSDDWWEENTTIVSDDPTLDNDF